MASTMGFTNDEAELSLVLLDRLREDGDTFWNRVLDGAEERIRSQYDIRPTPQQIYDADMKVKVDAILAADEDHQKWLREKPARDQLFADALAYMDWNHYNFWELKLKDSGFPEPTKKGCVECKPAYDEYMSHANANHLQHDYDELQRQRGLLDSAHARYMSRLRMKGPAKPIIFRGTGYTEEEE